MIKVIRDYIDFILSGFKDRKLLTKLAVNDFKVRYAGSYLGAIWAFIHPVITILVYWFVFQIGFKSAPVGDIPFILWLICGIIPWFFFSEVLNCSTNSLIEYNYLVKKMAFNINVLPMVKIISSLFVHLFFVMFIFIMFKLYGYSISIFNIQVFYYTFAMSVFLIGLSWLTSTLAVFVKDTSQIINIILQFGFWLTPIFWSYTTLPEKYLFIFKFNPMFYIIQGYRDSFIDNVWFWQRSKITLYYWGITFVVFMIGSIIFKRLKPHFSDVL